MTGFKPRRFVLEFEDPSFGGLEVVTRSASLDDLMRMQELMATPLGNAEYANERRELFERLGGTDERAGIIVRWNLLDDHDEPVPTDPSSLEKEEYPLIRAICRAWIAALIEVPRPLSLPSSDGDRLAELNIPMTTLPSPDSSASLPPSSEPNG
jgi:hypothetical protein